MTEFTAEKMLIERQRCHALILDHRCNLTDDYLCRKLIKSLEEIERLQQRTAELEQERRWIPIDEATQLEHGFYLFESKRGNHSIGCFPLKNGKVNFFDAVKIYNMKLYPPHMKPPQEEE